MKQWQSVEDGTVCSLWQGAAKEMHSPQTDRVQEVLQEFANSAEYSIALSVLTTPDEIQSEVQNDVEAWTEQQLPPVDCPAEILAVPGARQVIAILWSCQWG